MCADDGKPPTGTQAIGLCGRCRHVRAQSTKRGAIFYRCALADSDDRFMRYPPIPVFRCSGFTRATGSTESPPLDEGPPLDESHPLDESPPLEDSPLPEKSPQSEE